MQTKVGQVSLFVIMMLGKDTLRTQDKLVIIRSTRDSRPSLIRASPELAVKREFPTKQQKVQEWRTKKR
ncbi:MAG: hypothetical protein HRF42_09890 [Candidatus Brocadia sp.]